MAAFLGSAPIWSMSSSGPSTKTELEILTDTEDETPKPAIGRVDTRPGGSFNRRPGPQRFIYGRGQTPRLKESHKRLIRDLLPKLSVQLPLEHGPVVLAELGLDHSRPLWLEIGFGGGEHLAALAAANRDVTMVGVEPFLSGVAKLLVMIDKSGLDNVRLLMDDARLLLGALPDRSLARAFILYPDPWPKLRHHKRRIINDTTVAQLARVLEPGAELRIATDHADYRRWILAVMRRAPAFQWLAECRQDWACRPHDQIVTRYEEKAELAGRTPVYLRYQLQN